MLSKKLANSIQAIMEPQSTTSFNLNFKIEGSDADKLDAISVALGKSKTELAKLILTDSLDDLLAHINSSDFIERRPPAGIEELDKTIIRLTTEKIAALNTGNEFELSDLIGDDWDQFGVHGDKNKAGKAFKKLVDSGDIKNVKFLRTKPNRHALYAKT